MEKKLNTILEELGYGDDVKEVIYDINKRCKRATFSNNAIYHEFFVDLMFDKTSNEHFDMKGNILILADRLYGIGIGLEYYFRKNTEFTVLGVAKTLEEALDFSEQIEVDIIVSVGYQENKDNYKIIQILNQRKKVISFMWALIDELTAYHYEIYYMTGIFDRNKPLENFVEYILSHYQKNV